MTTSRGGSPSSAAPEEKKGKEMTMSQGGSPSFTTPKKMQKMSTSWEALDSLSSLGIL
jgi:acetylglutamate synthase